jgi:hypothetical protein
MCQSSVWRQICDVLKAHNYETSSEKGFVHCGKGEELESCSLRHVLFLMWMANRFQSWFTSILCQERVICLHFVTMIRFTVRHWQLFSGFLEAAELQSMWVLILKNWRRYMITRCYRGKRCRTTAGICRCSGSTNVLFRIKSTLSLHLRGASKSKLLVLCSKRDTEAV